MNAFNIFNFQFGGRVILSAFAFLIYLSAAAVTPAAAKGVRGNISGTVTDPNGAAVVGANVRLINIANQQEVRTVQTNNEGVYQFLEIEPLNYDVLITAAGFSEACLRNAKIEPNRTVRLDATLGLTGTAEEVRESRVIQLGARFQF
jgi:hypothetical protein